jgi:hypothetical protein
MILAPDILDIIRDPNINLMATLQVGPEDWDFLPYIVT